MVSDEHIIWTIKDDLHPYEELFNDLKCNGSGSSEALLVQYQHEKVYLHVHSDVKIIKN
jgi:hypothetical protein